MRLFLNSTLALLCTLSMACKENTNDKTEAPSSPSAEVNAEPVKTEADQAGDQDEPQEADDNKIENAGSEEPAIEAPTPESPSEEAGEPLTDEQTASIESGIKVFERMGSLIGEEKDCDKIAESLKTVVQEDSKTLAAFKATSESLSLTQQQGLATKYATRMEQASRSMMTTLISCRDNVKVQVTMLALETGESEVPDVDASKADDPVLANLESALKEAGDDCSKIGEAFAPVAKDKTEEFKAAVTKVQMTQPPKLNGDMIAFMKIMPTFQKCDEEDSIKTLQEALMMGIPSGLGAEAP